MLPALIKSKDIARVAAVIIYELTPDAAETSEVYLDQQIRKAKLARKTPAMIVAIELKHQPSLK